MSDRHIDFALFGSTTLTRLLAGLLASAHGKSVLLVGESQARFRLARGVDISVAPLTRPETWDLLNTLVPETTRIVAKAAGRSGVSRVAPIFFADGEPAKEALSHVRHMALAFGHAAERVAPRLLGSDRDGVVFRDAMQLQAAALEPLLDAWLDKLGVLRTGWLDRVEHRPDGSGSASWFANDAEFRHSILCDDTAVAAHFAEVAPPPGLVMLQGTTVLCQAVAPLAAPIMHQFDTGLTLAQGRHGELLALGRGGVDDFAGTLGRLLGDRRPPRQIGQVEYTLAGGVDGAPVLGTLPDGPAILAGLGAAAAFFAPAIARALCGVASPAEEVWFAAHAPVRNGETSPVAEWMAP